MMSHVTTIYLVAPVVAVRRIIAYKPKVHTVQSIYDRQLKYINSIASSVQTAEVHTVQSIYKRLLKYKNSIVSLKYKNSIVSLVQTAEQTAEVLQYSQFRTDS